MRYDVMREDFIVDKTLLFIQAECDIGKCIKSDPVLS